MTKKTGIVILGAILLTSFAVNIQAAKPTVKISALPTSIVVGSSSTLTWTSTGATSASINQGIGSVPVNGSRVVSPTATITYIITAKNSSGSATATAKVTVTAAPPTVSFSAAPDTIAPGGSSTLSWTTTNATSASINQGIGTVAMNGSKVVKPTTTKTYTITVKGSGGTVTAQATVTVAAAPPTVSFSAAPVIIEPGQSSKLTWSVQNATSISIDNGIGSVTANGSRTVTPGESITYTLTAQSTSGTTTRQATITVAEPPTVTFSAAPMSIKPGETSTLTWATTDATTASVDNTIGTVPVNGSIQVTPTQNITYTIIVSGPGGTVSAQTAVYISNGKICYAYVPNASMDSVAVIDTASNTVIKTIPTNKGPMGVAIKQDGTRVFISNISASPRYIHTIDTAANAVVDLNDTQYAICGAQFLAVDDTRTQKYLYGASLRSFYLNGYMSALFVYHLAQNGQIGQIKCLYIPGGEQGGMVLHPDGTRLYLSKPLENAILCLDTAKLHRLKPDGATYEYLTDEVTATIPITNPYSLVISPDGNRLYAVGTDGIMVIDTNSNTTLSTISLSSYCYSLAMHPDGSRLYAASASRVEAIDTVTNIITKTLTIDGYDSSMNVHPDGSRLYITSSSNDNVSVVDTANLTLIATITITGSPKAYGNFVGYISESIAGTVTQDGVGLADVKITVTNAEGSAVSDTDASGNYITAVAKGTYTLTPEKVGYTFLPDHKQIVVDQAVNGCNFTATTQAPTVTISAQPTIVILNQQTTITWSSTNATSAVFDDGVNFEYYHHVNDSAYKYISKTTTFTITVTGPGGTASANVVVTFADSITPTVTITAAPATIQAGGYSTLTWASTNGTSATIDNGIGSVPVNGSRVVTPAATTTYKITVIGPGGSANTSVTVSISEPPPTVTITAAPDTIPPGGSSTLTWTSTNATSVAINQGIGTVQLNGSLAVTPAVETIYTITATGPGGTTTASVTVKMLDALLRGVWNEMKTALASGNTNMAANFFDEETKANYLEIFDANKDQLPQIAADMRDIEPVVYFEDGGAQFRIKRKEILAGTEYDITYYIYFIRGNDGVWRILKY